MGAAMRVKRNRLQPFCTVLHRSRDAGWKLPASLQQGLDSTLRALPQDDEHWLFFVLGDIGSHWCPAKFFARLISL